MDATSSPDGQRAVAPFLNANPPKFSIALELVAVSFDRAKRLFRDGLNSNLDPDYRDWLAE